MKKNYVKPQLWAETFQPADAIAGNCFWDVGFGDGGEFGSTQCSLDEGGLNLFVNEGICRNPWKQGEDQPCYHSSVGDNHYFGS